MQRRHGNEGSSRPVDPSLATYMVPPRAPDGIFLSAAISAWTDASRCPSRGWFRSVLQAPADRLPEATT